MERQAAWFPNGCPSLEIENNTKSKEKDGWLWKRGKYTGGASIPPPVTNFTYWKTRYL
jgi:hypothetical protein